MVSRSLRAGALRISSFLGHEFTASRFSIELAGLLTATFKECSGLSGEIEVETFREGGLNSYEHKLPGRVKYGNITLKSGVAAASEMWDWFYDVSMGNVERKNVSIIMHFQSGIEGARWNLEAAYPVRWEGPSFAAGSAEVTIQTLELAHNGIALSVG